MATTVAACTAGIRHRANARGVPNSQNNLEGACGPSEGGGEVPVLLGVLDAVDRAAGNRFATDDAAGENASGDQGWLLDQCP